MSPFTPDPTGSGGVDLDRVPTLYYQDEHVRLYWGNCLLTDVWLAADVLVSDTPYGIGWKTGENRRAGSRAHAGIVNDQDTSVRDAALELWGDKPGVVFGSFYAPEPPRRKQILVYRKPGDAGVVGSVTGFRRDVEPIFLIGNWPQRNAQWSSVLASRVAQVGGANGLVARYGHPHAKPVDLMEQLIAAAPAGVVADPFVGGGSTLVAAKLQGRLAIGVEVDERYCELAARRLSQDALPFGEAS